MTISCSFDTACGNTIHLTDNTIEHLRAHPEAGDLLEEAVGMVTLPSNGTFYVGELDFGRIIGKSSCIPVNKDAKPTFAVRVGRNKPTRVVVGGEKLDCNKFTLIAFEKHGKWTLITGYVGANAPREPHDRYFDGKRDSDEFRAALHFWSDNGLVWEPEVMGKYFESSWAEELGL